MGLFGNITSAYKKSEAAVVVQNLLEHQARVGLLDLDPKALANRLVSVLWDQKPDLFDGKFGQRPHKISVAAAALADGIGRFEAQDTNREALILALSNVLSEIETNGRLYPFNGIDEILLEAAGAIFVAMTEELRGRSGNTTPPSAYATFEDWYAEFKIGAGKANPALREADGSSLIDFMDHEPLRRAFRDRVEPRSLGTEFAKSFDIRKFGKQT